LRAVVKFGEDDDGGEGEGRRDGVQREEGEEEEHEEHQVIFEKSVYNAGKRWLWAQAEVVNVSEKQFQVRLRE
jgi:hypothetical protein